MSAHIDKRQMVCVIKGAEIRRVPGTSYAEDLTWSVGFVDGACAVDPAAEVSVYLLPEDNVRYADEQRARKAGKR